MDMALLKPLIEILDISINEMLVGEIITEKDIKNKTEDDNYDKFYVAVEFTIE